jgi:hypothetical protein
MIIYLKIIFLKLQMSSLNETDLYVQVNKIANVIIPEFYSLINTNFNNVMKYVNVYFYLDIFILLLLFSNLVISVIILKKLAKIMKHYE